MMEKFVGHTLKGLTMPYGFNIITPSMRCCVDHAFAADDVHQSVYSGQIWRFMAQESGLIAC